MSRSGSNLSVHQQMNKEDVAYVCVCVCVYTYIYLYMYVLSCKKMKFYHLQPHG